MTVKVRHRWPGVNAHGRYGSDLSDTRWTLTGPAFTTVRAMRTGPGTVVRFTTSGTLSTAIQGLPPHPGQAGLPTGVLKRAPQSTDLDDQDSRFEQTNTRDSLEPRGRVTEPVPFPVRRCTVSATAGMRSNSPHVLIRSGTDRGSDQ